MAKIKKKQKRALVLIALIIIVIFGAIIYFLMNIKNNNNDKNNKVLSKISGYNYKLTEMDTELSKKLFNELKELLDSKNVDDKEFAKLISELFITDLYTLSNKPNKYAVNSKQYVLPEYQENFALKVNDTLYNYIGTIDKLPEVSSIEVENIQENSVTLNEKQYNVYEIDLKWEYKKDYGYDKKGTVAITKEDKYMYVVDYKGEGAV